jgi:formylglycine-generating enzyme required for sulfatase activity
VSIGNINTSDGKIIGIIDDSIKHPNSDMGSEALLSAANLFEKALQFRASDKSYGVGSDFFTPGGYIIARKNRIDNRFNYGAVLLNQYLGQKDTLLLALRQFDAVAQLAGGQFLVEKVNAYHASGITYFYLNQRDSAQSIYTQLKTKGYFDTLTLRPNLQTLLLNIPASPTVPVTGSPAPNLQAILADIQRSMVFVKGGTFTMGSPETETDRGDDEKQHTVTLSDFEMGRTEVTVVQYMAFVNETKSHYPEWMEAGSEYNVKTGTDNHYKTIGAALTNSNNPIVGVSWDDAIAYCQWLSQKIPGKKFRLPTEAEWEYAARGGLEGIKDGFTYAGSNNIETVAWYDKNSGSKTHSVGQKKANELGLYDMSGNVWEWCNDWYGDYSSEAQTNPTGPTEGSGRVRRGGSWRYTSAGARVARRDNWLPGSRGSNLGFRLARTR